MNNNPVNWVDPLGNYIEPHYSYGHKLDPGKGGGPAGGSTALPGMGRDFGPGLFPGYGPIGDLHNRLDPILYHPKTGTDMLDLINSSQYPTMEERNYIESLIEEGYGWIEIDKILEKEGYSFRFFPDPEDICSK